MRSFFYLNRPNKPHENPNGSKMANNTKAITAIIATHLKVNFKKDWNSPICSKLKLNKKVHKRAAAQHMTLISGHPIRLKFLLI